VIELTCNLTSQAAAKLCVITDATFNTKSEVIAVFLYCWFFCTLDAGLLARSQYPESPATGHLDTGFSWFPCVYKQAVHSIPAVTVLIRTFSSGILAGRGGT